MSAALWTVQWGAVYLAEASDGDIVLELRPELAIAAQWTEFLRAAAGQNFNRGNSRVKIALKVQSSFDTVEDANLYINVTQPNALVGVSDTTIVFTGLVSFTLNDAVVESAKPTPNGTLVIYDYQLSGGAITT